jgi:hypothetical protein
MTCENKELARQKKELWNSGERQALPEKPPVFRGLFLLAFFRLKARPYPVKLNAQPARAAALRQPQIITQTYKEKTWDKLLPKRSSPRISSRAN